MSSGPGAATQHLVSYTVRDAPKEESKGDEEGEDPICIADFSRKIEA